MNTKMIAAAAIVALSTGGAWAMACDAELPNNQWTQEDGPETTTLGGAERSGNSGNWSAFLTTSIQCIVYNPQGKLPPDQQYSIILTAEEVKLCQNVGNTGSEVTEAGTLLGVTSCTREGGPVFGG